MSDYYEKATAEIEARLDKMSPDDRQKALELLQTKAALVIEARKLGIPTETPDSRNCPPKPSARSGIPFTAEGAHSTRHRDHADV